MSDEKIDPGVGYRLLGPNDVVQYGDEYFHSIRKEWTPSVWIGKNFESVAYDGSIYRRKLKARKKIYIAGPMRGIRLYNFPAFDDAAERLYNQGWDPINPADIDRDCNFDPEALPECWNWDDLPETLNLHDIIRRDVDALMGADAVYVLPGYERSRGSRAEIALAEWLNLEVIYEAKEPEAPVAPIFSANAELQEAAEPHFNWAEGIEALKSAEAEAQAVEDILLTALRITRGDRQAQYGPPDQDFRRTAAMWNGMFGHMLAPGASFEAMHIALAMILLKASRQIHQRKSDNWVDIAGYARCGSICDQMA